MARSLDKDTEDKAKTVIAAALMKCNIEPCLKILKAGFHVDTPMEMGTTLLMMVSGVGTEQMVNQILQLNPDLDARDNVGRTALHFAAKAGNLGAFRVLVELEDVEIDAVTVSGTTPLMSAVESGHIQVVAEGLNNNLNPFLRDGLGRTAMDIATKYSDSLGDDMRNLIQNAQDQWMTQTTEDDRTGTQ